jgi:hypothetical protein
MKRTATVGRHRRQKSGNEVAKIVGGRRIFFYSFLCSSRLNGLFLRLGRHYDLFAEFVNFLQQFFDFLYLSVHFALFRQHRHWTFFIVVFRFAVLFNSCELFIRNCWNASAVIWFYILYNLKYPS